MNVYFAGSFKDEDPIQAKPYILDFHRTGLCLRKLHTYLLYMVIMLYLPDVQHLLTPNR